MSRSSSSAIFSYFRKDFILFELQSLIGVSVGFHKVIAITCLQVWEYSPAGHANEQS